MIAILGGLGAAAAFAGTTLCSARSTRLIGPFSVLTWVMVTGFVAITPFVAATGIPAGLDAGSGGWLVLSGAGNVGGLLLAYGALRAGRVGIIAPILSTEGAIAALIAVLAGEGIAPAPAAALGVIAAGVVLASLSGEATPDRPREDADTLLLSIAAALCFGASLYATGRAGTDVGIVWAVLPARVIGVAVVAIPLAARRRVRLTREAVPLVVAGGLFEILGFASYTIGARHALAVSAVLASQFGALAGIAAFLLFRERLRLVQIVGVAAIAAGVAALSALQT